MANEEHLAILRQGVEVWNKWRSENQDQTLEKLLRGVENAFRLLSLGKVLISKDAYAAHIRSYEIDLQGANLSGMNLSRANLAGVDLSDSILTHADLTMADLSVTGLARANLTGASMVLTEMTMADLRGAILVAANLHSARLIETDLSGSDLSDADLSRTFLYNTNLTKTKLNSTRLETATLIGANLSGASIENCTVYGISVWDINLEGAVQKNLNISPSGHATVTVDNLKVAQFIYLLLNNTEIRDVIDTMTGKAALILGRFTTERKAILDALRDALRERGYLPILFDFEKPASKDLTETVRTLASLSRFIIADLTDAKSIPQELMAIVPNMPSLAVQSIIIKNQRPYAMYEHFERFPWVLPLHEYESQESLIAELAEKVIKPAEQKANEQRPKPL